MKKTVITFSIIFFLYIFSVFALSNWLDYCNDDDSGSGAYCFDDTFVLEAENNLIDTRNDVGFGTQFNPLVYDWNLDGEDEIIFITGATNLRTYNLSLILKGSVTVPSIVRQPILTNMFNVNSTKDNLDVKQLVYIGDNDTGDGHFDLIFINKTNLTFTVIKIIPLRGMNETSGISCFDYDNDGIRECVFMERSGFVRAYEFNDNISTDSEINQKICGTVRSQLLAHHQ